MRLVKLLGYFFKVLLLNDKGRFPLRYTDNPVFLCKHESIYILYCMSVYLCFFVGLICSHLQGMFTRTIRLLEAGMEPV